MRKRKVIKTEFLKFHAVPEIPLLPTPLPDEAPTTPRTSATPNIPSLSLKPTISVLPSAGVAFQFPPEEANRVRGWFTGDYHGVTGEESPTLARNRREAIYNTVASYLASHRNQNHFTAPFRIGWRYKYASGNFGRFGNISTLCLNRTAPTLRISSYNIQTSSVATQVAVGNTPAVLNYTLPSGFLDNLRAGEVTHIEFYATREPRMYPESSQFSGIGSMTYAGAPARCWVYDRYLESSVAAAVAADTEFRLICSLKIEGLEDSNSPIPLPLPAGTLANFDRLPKLTESDKEETVSPPQIPGAWHVISEPFSLDLLDTPTRVRRVSLSGLLPRRETVTTLYASFDRERWRFIARSRGGTISGLVTPPYPWWRLEVNTTLRHSDRLDAVVFE